MLRFARRNIAIVATLLCSNGALQALTNYYPYDPYPLFTSAEPHEFLYTSIKDELMGRVPDIDDERCNITASFFAQRAVKARTLEECHVPLGDFRGLWNTFGLLYDRCPCGPDLLASITATQFNVCDTPSCGLSASPTNVVYQYGDPNAFTTLEGTAISPNLGKLSVPLEYRKMGARFEAAVSILEDWMGLKLQFGLAEIQQKYTCSGYIPLNDNPPGVDAPASYFNAEVTATTLTDTAAFQFVTSAVGLDVNDFKEFGVEDLKLQIFLRHAFPVNYSRSGWPKFLFMPFAQIIGSIGTAKRISPSKLLAVPFGNNGHSAVAFNVGFAFDFEDTIELTAEGGGTFFFKERIDGFRLPTNKLQSVLYPCTATVNYTPGTNWHFILGLYARRFIDRLSAHVQLVLLNHLEDEICVIGRPNTSMQPAFRPQDLTPKTRWDDKLINFGLNYDIAPYMTLGVLWQAPLKIHGGPTTNTIVASFIANF